MNANQWRNNLTANNWYWGPDTLAMKKAAYWGPDTLAMKKAAGWDY